MNLVSCGYRLVYETLDSIDEVWSSQDQKAELSCFFPKLSIPDFFLAASLSSLDCLPHAKFSKILLKPISFPLNLHLVMLSSSLH
jgi:hypothetical protein